MSDNKVFRYDIYRGEQKFYGRGKNVAPPDGFVQPNQAWAWLEKYDHGITTTNPNRPARDVLRDNGFTVRRRIRVTGANVVDATRITLDVAETLGAGGKVGLVKKIFTKIFG